MPKIKKILIANRGEIALRVIRACREMGIASVALFTAADKSGLWLRKADEAYEVEGFRGREGYLSVDTILSIARKAEVDAIHPGYGFLSERSNFADACRAHNIAFIGPTPEAMDATGDKGAARALAVKSGIPVLNGSDPLSQTSDALRYAESIGYPVLLKAVAGGGGRGMRLVHSREQMESSFTSASREALSSFGNGTLYVEKYLVKPRHIEMQIMADEHGNAFYLGERECSLQRRYQKIVEESPSVAVDESLRKQLGEYALHFVQQAGYTNAGTIEFLLDENKQVYFLEMNARIQVEHCVTEMVTGFDLVKAQIKVAQGEKLTWEQRAINLRGWSIEARINCEDPDRDFLPSPGTVNALELPGGPGVRLDTALYPGYEIPGDFDSLIAKLVCWGEDRNEAIARMQRALREFRVEGIPTTIPFHQRIFAHSDFIKGDLSTKFLEEHGAALRQVQHNTDSDMAAIIALFESQSSSSEFVLPEKRSAWAEMSRWEKINH